MPTLTLSTAEQFALNKGLALDTNPKHGVFRGIPVSSLLSPSGIILARWRGWSNQLPSVEALSFYAFQGWTAYQTTYPQLPFWKVTNADIFGVFSITTVPATNQATLRVYLGITGGFPPIGSKIIVTEAVPTQYNTLYTVTGGVSAGAWYDISVTRDDNDTTNYGSHSVGTGIGKYHTNTTFFTTPSTSSVNADGELVYKKGNLAPSFSTVNGTIGNWLSVQGTFSSPNTGYITQNLSDAGGSYLTLNTEASIVNAKSALQDFDPRHLEAGDGVGGAPSMKIGERKLHFKAKVQIVARASDVQYNVGFWRTHTTQDPQIEWAAGENCVCFYNIGSGTWRAKVNRRFTPAQLDVEQTHNFVTTASVEEAHVLEIIVNAEGTSAIFLIDGLQVYEANGGLPVMSQDFGYTTDIPQTGVFAGATVRATNIVGGAAAIGTLKVYSMNLFNQNNFHNAGLKLLKKLK